jgi:hypothetical protein
LVLFFKKELLPRLTLPQLSARRLKLFNTVVETALNIICITGPVPGIVTATVSHQDDVRAVVLEVAPHPAGGWHARLLNSAAWGLRCHTVPTAIMLEAAEVFADTSMMLAAD